MPISSSWCNKKPEEKTADCSGDNLTAVEILVQAQQKVNQYVEKQEYEGVCGYFLPVPLAEIGCDAVHVYCYIMLILPANIHRILEKQLPLRH